LNPLTHKILAQKLYQELSEVSTPQILYRKSFIWGSMRPDFVRESIPHFKSRGDKQFYKKCGSFINNMNQLNQREFSGELGQIFHYIGDFFCQAHNKKLLVYNKRHHFLNEIHLQKFIKNIKNNFFDISMRNMHENSRGINVRKIIESEYKRFEKDKFSFQNDLHFAYRVSALIGRKMIKNYVQRRSRYLAA